MLTAKYSGESMKAFIWVLVLQLLVPVGFCNADDRPSSNEQRSQDDQRKLLEEGASLLRAKRPQQAISYFDQIISFYEAKYRDRTEQVYCARARTEVIFYLAKHAKEKKTNAIVIGVWCDAQYLKAYALVELGRLSDAKAALEAAMVLAPSNSQYLSELGNVYLRERNWPRALEIFHAAEDAAGIWESPAREAHLARAHRGAGYALIELGRLDDAEAKYKQSMAIDPADRNALRQLGYIHQLRAKSALK